MTEIVNEEMKLHSKMYLCAVDNHNKKDGTTYQIIYKSRDPNKVMGFMIEKGLI